MGILFIILISLVSFIAFLLLAALFIKKEYTIERSITINKPKQEVFNYVRFLKNQEHFSKWVMTDPLMKKVLTGTDGTVGFIYAWDSENKQAGKGEQEIIGIKEGEKIDVEVRFERPFVNTAKTPFTLKTVSNQQTQITWGMIGQNKYPMNLMTFLIAGMLNKDLDISLHNLKTILEK
jgi:uncharacterized protein YndB with AHSA1/START domain